MLTVQQISALGDPGADRILFWDESSNQFAFLTAGTGLTITGTTIAATAGTGDVSKVGTPVNNQVGVWTGDGTLEGDAALTFDTTTDVLSSGGILLSGLTASEIVITDASKNLVSAAVATYPSLTELSYVKGVTSAIQTQLNAKGTGNALTSNPLSQFASTTSAQLAGVLSDETGTGSLVFATNPVFSGYMDIAGIAHPASPAAGYARLHATTANGVTELYRHNEQLIDINIGQDSVTLCKNTSGSTMTKGQVVYVLNSTGNVPNIALAKADATTTIKGAVGIVLDTITNNSFGQIMLVGVDDNIDTSAFATGDALYVSATVAGGLTATRPVYPNFVKHVGIVLVSGVGNGSFLVNCGPFTGGMESGTNSSTFTAAQLVSNVATGTAPFVVTSTTAVANLSIGGNAATATAVAVGGITGLGTGVATALAVNIGTAGAPVVNGGALGTPSSGTLTNATGLPAASVVAGTLGVTGTRMTKLWATDIESTNMPTVGGTAILTSLTAPQFTTIELGAATDTTLARVSAGVVSIEGITIDTISATSTLTNKRIEPRIVSAASYTTDTGTSLDVSTTDIFVITAQAGALLFNSPGGTPVQGQRLVIRIKDNATARALTWNAVFRAMGTALPSTTVLSKTLYLGFFYNSTDVKWDLVASAQES